MILYSSNFGRFSRVVCADNCLGNWVINNSHNFFEYEGLEKWDLLLKFNLDQNLKTLTVNASKSHQ